METPERVVWARNEVATTVCPKSYITGQSMAWLEEYLVRRKLGQKGIENLEARAVEAFVILEHEVAKLDGNANEGSRAGNPSNRRRNV